ncbi:MAG TPA: hypothetical protein VFQ53_09615 [Kofleriaceae bacterium]|nr:hypothetical protein [Kofleriaceae bacterium]
MTPGAAKIGHLDERGEPCRYHEAPSLDTILHYATIGSRMSGFHHDVASKLQGLMMAVDEISELAAPTGNEELERAAQTALDALKDLNALLTTNRALAKPPVKARTTLRELATRAGERVGIKLGQPVVDATLEVSAPAVIHGLALAFDVAAGAGRSRTLDVRSRLDGKRVELVLPLSATPIANASEALAIAAWVLGREAGRLACRQGAQLVVELAVS